MEQVNRPHRKAKEKKNKKHTGGKASHQSGSLCTLTELCLPEDSLRQAQIPKPSPTQTPANFRSKQLEAMMFVPPKRNSIRLNPALTMSTGQREATPRPHGGPHPRGATTNHLRHSRPPRSRKNHPRQVPRQALHKTHPNVHPRPHHRRSRKAAAPHLHGMQ